MRSYVHTKHASRQGITPHMRTLTDHARLVVEYVVAPAALWLEAQRCRPNVHERDGHIRTYIRGENRSLASR